MFFAQTTLPPETVCPPNCMRCRSPTGNRTWASGGGCAHALLDDYLATQETTVQTCRAERPRTGSNRILTPANVGDTVTDNTVPYDENAAANARG